MKTIERDVYLNKLISFMGDGQIKVVTGIRRCGKSFLLRHLFVPYLKKRGIASSEIMIIELDKISFIKYRNPLTLAKKARSFAASSKREHYLFIDEIQDADEAINPTDKNGKKINIFDALIDLMGIGNLDIYVTGSNSVMLSNDVLTNFRGRSDEVRVHPLSFKESLSVLGPSDPKRAFEEYCFYGGMPLALSKKGDEEKMDYLKGLFDGTYLKDILDRNDVRKDDVLSMTIDFLSSSVGSLTNPSKIARSLASKGHPAEDKTIALYLGYLKNAFLFSEAKRYDVRGKSYFDYPSKYYCEDVGLRNARVGFRQQELTHIMENVVYNELRYRGYVVDVGVVEERKNSDGKLLNIQREIDFVATKGSKKIYVQSAFAIVTDEKMKSEKAGFLLAKDSFRKVIVRGDIGKNYQDEDGVLHVGVISFLLGSDWE